MFAALRTPAAAVLLVASLSAQAASSLLLLHIATEHRVAGHHPHHDHHAEPEGEDLGHHGGEHSHELGPAPAAAPPARTLTADLAFHPLAPVWHEVSGAPIERAALLLAPATQRAGPHRAQRHSILLL